MWNNLSLRERVLLILGILILLGVGYYFYLYLPQQEKIQVLEQEFVAKKQELEDLKILKVKYQQLADEYAEVQSQWQENLEKCYYQDELPQLLKKVELLAGDLDLNILTFVPGMTKKEGSFIIWPLNLEMAGQYKGVVMFIDHLAREFGLHRITDLKIHTGKEQKLICKLKVEFLLMEEGEQG